MKHRYINTRFASHGNYASLYGMFEMIMTTSISDRIIKVFEGDRYYGNCAQLVKFLFNTGCRPSEAIALQWKCPNYDV